jgi:hypothetical protein
MNTPLFASLSLACLMTLSLSSFADKTPHSAETVTHRSGPNWRDDLITASFNKDFKNAEVLNWEITRTISRVTFKMNDLVLYAYYSDKGELLAVSRNILTTQLPLGLMLDIRQNYTQYWVTDLFEMTSDDQTTYYITLENASSHLVLKSAGADGWEFYQKTARD